MMRCLFGRFLPLLVQANLVTRSQKKNPAGYGAYDVYYLTPKGNQQLHALAQQPPPPLLLPVPDSVRKAEVTPGTAWMPCTAPRASFDALSRCRIWQEVDRQAATKTKAEVEALRERLRVAGYDLAAVPESEVRRCHRSARSPPRLAVSVEARVPWYRARSDALAASRARSEQFEPGAEKTPVASALLHWARTLDAWRQRGAVERAEAHEDLFKRLHGWRSAEAQRLCAAPTDRTRRVR